MSFAEVFTSIDGVGAQLFFDAEQLVQLCQALGSARRARLDLASTQTDNEVSNGGILSLARTVGDHDAPASGLGVESSLDTLSNAADLVDLEQKGVASFLLNSSGNALGVGDSQVITNELEVGGVLKMAPVVPVILVKGVFNGNN